VIVLPASIVFIWTVLFRLGVVTLIAAIALTVLVTAALVTGLVMMIRGRTIRLPPEGQPPL
jgi:hypothetical protein